MSGLTFTKMHGLGNDFVIIDARAQPVALDEARARALADRHTGVGCDQVIVIEPAANGDADAFMRIRNADGGEVAACGNAMRCVAAVIADEAGRTNVRIETLAGILDAEIRDARTVTVDMGAPALDWRRIPLAREQDTLRLDLALGPLDGPAAVNMGNPHAVFFVDDADAVDLAALGPELEHHPMFPERANIGIAQIQANDRMRLRVWERGAGITMACGTGACAATVAAHRRGLTGRAVEVALDGGTLAIEWRDDDHVLMTGPVAVSFSGRIDDGLEP
jgi:diaminopimelate epimerase